MDSINRLLGFAKLNGIGRTFLYTNYKYFYITETNIKNFILTIYVYHTYDDITLKDDFIRLR